MYRIILSPSHAGLLDWSLPPTGTSWAGLPPADLCITQPAPPVHRNGHGQLPFASSSGHISQRQCNGSSLVMTRELEYRKWNSCRHNSPYWTPHTTDDLMTTNDSMVWFDQIITNCWTYQIINSFLDTENGIRPVNLNLISLHQGGLRVIIRLTLRAQQNIKQGIPV